MLSDFFNTDLTLNDLWFLAQGAGRTLLLTAIAVGAGTAIGIVLGVIRAERGWISNVLIGSVLDILRSVPLLIQLIIFNSFVSIIGFPLSAFASGAIVLSVYMAANCTEVVRAGVNSVSRDMRRAARSLGMSYFQDLFYVVIPIGFRTVFPAWIGVVLGVMKDSALVSVLGYFELLKSSQTLITRTQEPLLLLCLVGIFYFILSYPVARLASKLERSMSK
ncbi:MAG: amino acid ABC transporter permease [Cohaesibacter sp.]|nr:amino acid ABC transporter permease [Cohaesibacter sp.]